MISSHELARLCGVSQGTVDRALHGRPGISAATRARILAMAEAHGFVSNPVTQEVLGRAASTLVGIVAFEGTLQRPFFMDLVAALSPALRAVGQIPSLWLVGPDGMAPTVREVAARRPQAIILVRPPPDLVLPPVLVEAQPVVSLVLPCATPGVINLMPDERLVGATATRHLLACGHRRILHLTGGPAPQWAREQRAAGYEEAMRSAGLEPSVWWDPLDDQGRLASRVAALAPTAVFCHNDRLALRLRAALAAGPGLRVPEDVSLVGVDHSPIIRSLGLGPTSIPYPIAAIIAQVMATIARQPLPPLPAPAIVDGALTVRRVADAVPPASVPTP